MKQWYGSLCVVVVATATWGIFSAPDAVGQAGPSSSPSRDSALLAQYQASFRARAAWMQANGLQHNYEEVRALFTPERLEKIAPADRRASPAFPAFIDLLAQDIAVAYSADSIRHLAEKGTDIIDAYTDQTDLVHSVAAKSDLIAIGEVVSVNTAEDLGDDYASTVTVRLIETLKGKANNDVFLLRETTGYLKNGRAQVGSGGLVSVEVGKGFRVPTPGTQYLFFVSKSAYTLQVLRQDKTLSAGVGPYYVYQYWPLRIAGDSLVLSEDHPILSAPPPERLSTLRTMLAAE